MNNTIAIRGVESVTIEANAASEARKVEALAAAKEIVSVSDDFTRDMAVDALRAVNGLLKDVEQSRAEVKAPVLELGRKIDGIAKAFGADLYQEQVRVNYLLNQYAAEQRKIAAEAERARQAELARIETERRRLEAEAVKRAEEAARVEDDRARAEADAAASLSPEEAAAADHAAAKAHSDAIALAAKAEADARAVAELDRQRVSTQLATLPREAPRGTATQDVPMFEVLDLAKLYAARPEFVKLTPQASAINAALRGGLTECPGLRIWRETKVTVRA